MIPPALLARLSSCSPAELAVFWRAAETLLAGLERGRAQYGTEPGRDGRDYVTEAQEELRDAALYLAMHTIQRATAHLPQTHSSEAGSSPREDERVVIDPAGPTWSTGQKVKP
jgi:hypothetical protein